MRDKRLCLSLLRPILRAKTVTVGNLAGDLGEGGLFAAEHEQRCRAGVQYTS